MFDVVTTAASMIGAVGLCAAAWLFARSLLPGATPLVARFAQAADPGACDRPGAPAYLRALTALWSLVLLAGAALVLQRFLGWPGVPGYVALLLPPGLTAALFFGERPLRRRIFGADAVGPVAQQWQVAMRILRQELLGSARERPEDMPLLRAADGERNALAWRDRECTMAQLLHAATALAAALPPGRRVLVACEDRAVFLWVLLALWAARRTAVMPSPDLKFGSDGVEDAAFDSIVTDRTDLQHGAVATLRVSLARLQQELVAAQQPPVPSLALPSAHPAVVFFTSGSTGRPTMQAKTWGQLCEAADAMAALLRMQDARALLAGTVVHSHMFGFEMLVMQVLRGSCTLYAHRIVYPSDLAAFAAQPGARKWLVSTPYHLQVFADGGPLPAGLARVVSATMPLTAELAARVEADSGAEVHEIYGSTEAGCIAKRRTVAGESWALAPDLRLRIDADGAATLHGARLGCALRLRDRITVTDDGFELNGRDTDMVKVAGKRTSLQALSAILRDIDGVHDGVFVDGTALGQTRLAAIAVAPGLAAETIRDTLASRIDAAFLPRPLVLVPELPRDANGKLLADLIAPAIAEARAAARRRPVLTVQPQHT